MSAHKRQSKQDCGHSKPPELRFLVSTDVEKPDADLRKFIRSHVMQGKNKGKTPRPHVKKPRKRKHTLPESGAAKSSNDTDQRTTQYSALVPKKFGATWSSVHLPAGVDPTSVEVVLQCKSSASQ
jgi:hypothetical protein